MSWTQILAMLAAVAGFILPLEAVTAAPASRKEPSFDCRKASSGAEKAICSNPELAQLDRHTAERFEMLLTQFDVQSAKALREDQRWFTHVRDLWMDENQSATPDEVLLDLKATLEYRAKFLDSIIARPGAGMEGTWSNLAGAVEVTVNAGQAVSVSFNVAEPAQGRWVCEASGSYHGTSVTGEVVDPSVPDHIIGLVRAGPRLEVEERSKDGEDQSSPFCGLNGSLTGSYFRVNQSAEVR